jgi:osmoprotectant transport system permease protein
MSFLLDNPALVLRLAWQHAGMTGGALLVALAVALPLGALLARRPRSAALLLGAFGVVYTIPSLALIVFLVPAFGLNATSVTAALILYMQVILVRNVVVGLRSIDPAVAEAAVAMGLSPWQRWWRIDLPLALPFVAAGARVAVVAGIGIATIGAKFNAGGLGTLLFDGIAQAGRYDKIWAGAIAVGALAFAANVSLLALERALGARFARSGADERPAGDGH